MSRKTDERNADQKKRSECGVAPPASESDAKAGKLLQISETDVIFCNTQHGFRNKFSCLTKLFLIIREKQDNIIIIRETGDLDFQETFDRHE